MPRDGIDRRALKKFTDGIQKEFDKNPVYLRVQADDDQVGPLGGSSGTTVNNYHGPVFVDSANGAQIAWSNHGTVSQEQHANSVAAGYEDLAAAIAAALQELPSVGLDDRAESDATQAGNDVLVEATKPAPDKSLMQKALNAFKGALAPIAMGLTSGASEGAQQWAHEIIAGLPTF